MLHCVHTRFLAFTQVSWDELQWLKGIQADTSVMEGCGDQRGGPTNKKRDHMRNLGIYDSTSTAPTETPTTR